MPMIAMTVTSSMTVHPFSFPVRSFFLQPASLLTDSSSLRDFRPRAPSGTLEQKTKKKRRARRFENFLPTAPQPPAECPRPAAQWGYIPPDRSPELPHQET